MGKLKKILVVDSDGHFSSDLMDFLKKACFDTQCVYSEMSVLLALNDLSDISLIILDNNIPDCKVFAFAELVHEQNPKLPIICISIDDVPIEYKKEFVAYHKKNEENFFVTLLEIIQQYV